MDAYDVTRKAIRERDKMLRDAYYGRNGLSMSEEDRANYKAMMDRVKECRRISREMQ